MNQILRIEYESNVLSEVINVQSVSWVFSVRIGLVIVTNLANV
jgi:hypothetical protein